MKIYQICMIILILIIIIIIYKYKIRENFDNSLDIYYNKKEKKDIEEIIEVEEEEGLIKEMVEKLDGYNTNLIINLYNNEIYTLGYEFNGIEKGDNYLIGEYSWLNSYITVKDNNGLEISKKNINNIKYNKTDVWKIEMNKYNKGIINIHSISNRNPELYPVYNNDGSTELSLNKGDSKQDIYLVNSEILLDEDDVKVSKTELRTEEGLYITLSNTMLNTMENKVRKVNLVSKRNENKWYIISYNMYINKDETINKYNKEVNDKIKEVIDKIISYG